MFYIFNVYIICLNKPLQLQLQLHTYTYTNIYTHTLIHSYSHTLILTYSHTHTHIHIIDIKKVDKQLTHAMHVKDRYANVTLIDLLINIY